MQLSWQLLSIILNPVSLISFAVVLILVVNKTSISFHDMISLYMFLGSNKQHIYSGILLYFSFFYGNKLQMAVSSQVLTTKNNKVL